MFKVEGETLVAACDEKVYGRIFEEGKLVLNVDRKFYGSEVAEWSRLLPLFKEATILNLVGEEVVSKAVEVRLIDPNSVLRVHGVPHAQMVRI